MQFLADLNMLSSMLEHLRLYLIQTPLNEHDRQRIEIAIEEALVNIISYAYPFETPGIIEMECKLFDKKFEVILKDYGKPFNPLKLPPAIDRNSSIEERKIGGLGIYFIIEFMDEVEYSRKEESNILFLRKRWN